MSTHLECFIIGRKKNELQDIEKLLKLTSCLFKTLGGDMLLSPILLERIFISYGVKSVDSFQTITSINKSFNSWTKAGKSFKYIIEAFIRITCY